MDCVFVIVVDESILLDPEKQKALVKGMRALAETTGWPYKDKGGKEHSIWLEDFDITFHSSSKKGDILPLDALVIFPTLVRIEGPRTPEGSINEEDLQKIIQNQSGKP